MDEPEHVAHVWVLVVVELQVEGAWTQYLCACGSSAMVPPDWPTPLVAAAGS